MFGVLDGLQKVAVAPWPAAVLRRAGPLARNAAGIADTRLGIEHLLHLDSVVPIVAKVVGVAESLVPQANELTELELPLVLHLHHVVRVRLAVLFTADLEGV